MRQGVAKFKMPEQVAIWDALPKNDAGKVLEASDPGDADESGCDDMQVAIVTGASSGIGFGCATKLAEAGMAVLGTGRDEDRLADLAKAIGDPRARRDPRRRPDRRRRAAADRRRPLSSGGGASTS